MENISLSDADNCDSKKGIQIIRPVDHSFQPQSGAFPDSQTFHIVCCWRTWLHEYNFWQKIIDIGYILGFVEKGKVWITKLNLIVLIEFTSDY